MCKAFDDCFSLPEQVSIYVPSTKGTERAEELGEKVAEQVAERFSALFGGATMTQGIGFWIGENKVLVRERVLIVYSCCTAEQLDEHGPEVRALAEQVKSEMEQEAVSVEAQRKLYFV